jgi:hypothetical protein
MPASTMMQKDFRRKLRPKSGVNAYSVESRVPAAPARSGPDAEGHGGDPVRVDAGDQGGVAVLRDGADGLSEIRPPKRAAGGPERAGAHGETTATDGTPTRTPSSATDFIV